MQNLHSVVEAYDSGSLTPLEALTALTLLLVDVQEAVTAIVLDMNAADGAVAELPIT